MLPPFIDAAHAAELLHTSTDEVLDLVAAGRLTPFAGPPSKPFLRSADVVALAEERGAAEAPAPKRTKSPSARVQARITADARWQEVAEDDMGQWLTRADPAARLAARRVVRTALDRLRRLEEMLGEE